MGFDGFDSVELVMDLEDAFGISIPDRDAERIHTAGQLHEYLVRRLAAVPDGPDSRCAGAAAFYRTRRVLIAAFGTDCRPVSPGAPIDRFLPAEAASRKDGWSRLGKTLGIRLPPLEHPKPLRRLAGAIGFVLLLSGLLALPISLAALPDRAAAGRAALGIGGTLIAAALLAPSLLLLATRSRAVHVPDGYATIGALSGALIVPEIERTRHEQRKWTRHQVWEVIRCYTARSAGVRPATVGPETRFIGDLP